MIRLNFEEPIDDEWSEWKTECQDETQNVINSFNNNNTFQITELYKGQKKRYFDFPFFGKCAYCETNIEVSSPCYVEHFRPKKGVRNLQNVIVTKRGTTDAHPGYYWLAYHLMNLLPTCYNCNTWHTDNSGNMVGKGNRFPVRTDYAENPGDEIHEQPLLINPLIDEPSDFLEIDDMGIMYSKNNSDRGNTTIELFGLNLREVLVGARKQEYDNIIRRVKLIYTMKAEDQAAELNELAQIAKGKNQYTIAAKKAIGDVVMEMQRVQDSLNNL